MHFGSLESTQKAGVALGCAGTGSTTGSMETVSRPSTNTFSDHSLSIIHVHKYHNPVNNQNPVSKKIQDTDINRLNNSTINRNKYYYSNDFEHNNGKTVTLKETYLMQKVQ